MGLGGLSDLSCFTYNLIKRHMEIFLQLPKGKMPSPCPWSAPTRRAFRRMAAWGHFRRRFRPLGQLRPETRPCRRSTNRWRGKKNLLRAGARLHPQVWGVKTKKRRSWLCRDRRSSRNIKNSTIGQCKGGKHATQKRKLRGLSKKKLRRSTNRWRGKKNLLSHDAFADTSTPAAAGKATTLVLSGGLIIWSISFANMSNTAAFSST